MEKICELQKYCASEELKLSEMILSIFITYTKEVKLQQKTLDEKDHQEKNIDRNRLKKLRRIATTKINKKARNKKAGEWNDKKKIRAEPCNF